MPKTPSSGPKGEDLARIPSAEIVRRFFPGTSKRVANLTGVIPGRDWPSGNLPKPFTAFDSKISKLINGDEGYRLIDDAELRKKGIVCPYYTWRKAVILSIYQSNWSIANLSLRRINEIKGEITLWNERIKRSTNLLNSSVKINEYIGSINLNDFDEGGDLSKIFKSQRNERLAFIKTDIEEDKRMIIGLQNELNRINIITKGKKGNKAPDIWYTSFFMNMSNMWKQMTGLDIVATRDDYLLISILNAAIQVAIGASDVNKSDDPKWGQSALLLKTFPKDMKGAGFDLGRAGWFEDRDEDRGKETRQLAEYGERYAPIAGSISGVIKAAFALKDHAAGDPACVMRDVVLRELLIAREAFSERLAIQLGWPVFSESESEKALRRLIISAKKKKDITSAYIVEIVFQLSDKSRLIVIEEGWSEPFVGITRSEIEDHYTTMLLRDDAAREADGNFKALHSAIILSLHYVSCSMLENAYEEANQDRHVRMN